MSNSDRFWDGSPKEPTDTSEFKAPFAARPRIRVHRSSPSTALRSKSMAQCRFCGHRIEYFDRFDDDGRIPMIPHLFKTAQIPQRLHWHVNGGKAYPGHGNQYLCRIPHPALCPMVEHADQDPDLEEMRTVLRVRTRKMIDAKTFVPDLCPSVSEDDVSEQHTEGETGLIRHLVGYTSALWLAPTVIDRVRCVARAASSGERCRNPVLGSDLYDGAWEDMDIPIPPGRAGQETLWAGTRMWVYGLHALGPMEFKRWIKQRCPSHAPGATSTPDETTPQWVRFDPLRHADFILYDRPVWAPEIKRERHGLLSRLALPRKPTQCAETGCRNGSAMPVPAEWRCYKCEPRHRHRIRMHRDFGSPPPDDGAPSAPGGVDS